VCGNRATIIFGNYCGNHATIIRASEFFSRRGTYASKKHCDKIQDTRQPAEPVAAETHKTMSTLGALTKGSAMRNVTLSLVRTMIILASLHGGAEAASPQMRTYVSGTGKDSNPCTESLPCKTFQAALALTLAGGEIFVLDSANYGAVTINKAVTITSEGAIAGVLATSGTGIQISAGPSDVVNLRGLDVDGGNTGTYGILFDSGQALNIQKSTIRNFTDSGIRAGTSTGTNSLVVSDTAVTNNGRYGIVVSPAGSGAVKGALTRVVALANGLATNGFGIYVFGADTTGEVSVTAADSVLNNNYYGAAAMAGALTIRNSTVTNNGVGILANARAFVRVGQSTLTGNFLGWSALNGGVLQSFVTNNVSGNQTDGTASSTLALQ